MSSFDVSKLQIGDRIIICGNKAEFKDQVFEFKGVSGDFLKVEPIGIITEEVYKDYVPEMKRFMKSTKESFFSIHDHKFQLITLCVVNDSFSLVFFLSLNLFPYRRQTF
jgi:hypothetical protein